MRLGFISALALAWAAAAQAEPTASLRVAERQVPSEQPYRRAELSLTNLAARAVETVLLRPLGGGPAVRHRFAVPPGVKGTTSVALPALSPVQNYALAALDADDRVLARETVEITWPADLVSDDAFITDAYRAWLNERPAWAWEDRRNGLLILAGLAVAAGAALLIRHPLLRAGAVLLLAGAFAFVLAVSILDSGAGFHVRRYRLVRYGPEGNAQIESFAVLSALRTGRCALRAERVPYPVYPDRVAAANDDSEVSPADRTIRLALRAGQARIVRPGPGKLALPAAAFSGTVHGRDDRFVVDANFPHPRALVVRNNSVWPLEPGFAPLRAELASKQARLIWGAPLKSAAWKPNAGQARLFAYWRDKHQQAGRTYLVNFPSDREVRGIDVLELRPAEPGVD